MDCAGEAEQVRMEMGCVRDVCLCARVLGK
jgi:hypothetical protein